MSPCRFSISFPVRCQCTVKVLFSKVELQGIHSHSRCDIDPSPKIASSITPLAGPPVAVATVSACRRKVLHKEASVYSDQNAGTEPAKQSEDLACTIRVLKGRLLGQCARSRFTDSGYNASRGVEDKESVSE